MRITLCDARTLSVGVAFPAVDKFYNWATGGLEQPFVAANHLRPLVPMEPPPSIHSTCLSADIGSILLERTDGVLTIYPVDATGNPTVLADCWTLPCPLPGPGFGGLSR